MNWEEVNFDFVVMFLFLHFLVHTFSIVVIRVAKKKRKKRRKKIVGMFEAF